MAQEEAERRSSARRKRIQLAGGGAAVVVVLAAVVIVILSGGGHSAAETGDVRQASKSAAKLPAQQISNVDAAAKAAGCKLEHPADEGRGHEDRDFKPSDYKTNPPTSGTHNPLVAQDGVYDPGNEPNIGHLVHSLEHGRIDIQYAPSTSAAVRAQLEAFVGENGGYHMLLYQNDTKMPYAVAATAWDQLLGCTQVNDKTWDALRSFRDRYLDKGPEQIP